MGREGRGKWMGGKGSAPKLLLNQGPSEPCYATVIGVGVDDTNCAFLYAYSSRFSGQQSNQSARLDTRTQGPAALQ